MLDDTINDVVPETSEDLTKQAINTYRKALKSHSDEDCARAFALAQKADKDNAEIQYVIGRCYRYGDGIDEDCLKAMLWYRKSAEQGNVDALFEIGDLYADNISEPCYDGFDETSSEDFIKWLSIALECERSQARIVFAAAYVNCVYRCTHPELELEKKVNKATDLELIRIAANGGHGEAQYRLGYRYELGDGVPQDYAEAARWYHKAAEKGSQYYYAEKLGEVYKKGLGVEKDYDEAIKWCHKAVVESLGIGKTIMNLAEVYELAGKYQDAVTWYSKAAESGIEEASKKLKKILANKERSGLRTECKNNNMTYADTEGVTMKKLTDKDYKLASEIAIKAIEANSLKDVVSQEDNPFLLSLYVPIANDRRKVVAAANEIFHGLGVLPAERTLKMGESDDYCYMTVVSDGDYYVLSFNHPKALSFTEGDEEYQYTIKYDHEQQEKEALAEEAEMHRLVAGIKMGRLKSKTPDGYLVLAGEFYDKIASREKAVEYRDFTEYNLKRTIGLKTIRFNRGYVKNAPHMKWSVKKVVLQDDDNNVCDPFDVPDNFWPTTIAIHLGERIK